VTALVVMGTHAFPAQIPEGALQYRLVLMTAAGTIWSGVDYAWRGIRMLRSIG